MLDGLTFSYSHILQNYNKSLTVQNIRFLLLKECQQRGCVIFQIMSLAIVNGSTLTIKRNVEKDKVL